MKKLSDVTADKWLHTIAGITLVQVIFALLRVFGCDDAFSFGMSVITSSAVMMLKETFWDGMMAKGRSDFYDFAYGMAGVVYGFAITYITWLL